LKVGAGLTKRQVEGKDFKAICERRGVDANGAAIPLEKLELELNLFRALSPTQALGAGLVVYAEGRDMVDQAVNALQFFRNESCGKCVPCRLGSQKMVALGTNLLEKKISSDVWYDQLLPLVNELGETMVLSSICALGRSVPAPLRTVMDFFQQDLAKYVPPLAGTTARVAATASPANGASAAPGATNIDAPARQPAVPTTTTTKATQPEVRP
jgi:NADH:ubiquinone oxidoreductase subunit F (NADH-binding)